MKRTLSIETKNKIGQKVRLNGWIQSKREHGKVIFFDLRDRWGIVQVVVDSTNQVVFETAKKIKPEWTVEIEGTVEERPEKMKNPNTETGNIEVHVENIAVLTESETLPFEITTLGYEISEEKRLTFRYLDLRRKRLQKNILMRHKVIQFMRDYLIKRGFIEIETPILTKATPEGARDFLVPSRLDPGKFYALPQSPQQYKQLLMVAGFEKYFQIARCFRDEDPRADRQPEFTQLDIEMSFVSQEDILNLIEDLFTSLVKTIFPEKKILASPFPRLTYQEAMQKYQTDRPDLRTNKNNSDELAFCFVVDFPMFEWHKEEKKWTAMHHPFTRPQTEDINKIKNEKEKVLAYQFDLVLNGLEIGGGSLRIYKRDMLEAVFEALGHTKEEIQEKFAHLLRAFEYGVPPHGGIAPGIDRFLQVVLNEPNIREVIAFPKTGDNRDPMMQTPSPVSKEQLKELHIKIEKDDNKKN